MEVSLLNSIYYKHENTPNWMKLWNYYYLNEKEFMELFVSTFDDFYKCNIDDKYVLIQMVGLFIFFSEENIIDKRKEDIIDIGKVNIDILKSRGLLKIPVNQHLSLDSSHRLEYKGLDINEFKEFVKYFKTQIESYRFESFREIAIELLDVLKRSSQDFDEKLLINTYGVSYYYDIPVLSYIPVEDFVSTFWRLPPMEKRQLGFTFKNRYTHKDFNVKLRAELGWLKEVYRRISEENISRNEKLTKYLVETGFLRLMENSIKSLENNTLAEDE